MADAPFFKESGHKAAVESSVNIPGPPSGAMHGAGVVGKGGAYPTFETPGMNGYGEVTSGQKGHPGTD